MSLLLTFSNCCICHVRKSGLNQENWDIKYQYLINFFVAIFLLLKLIIVNYFQFLKTGNI